MSKWKATNPDESGFMYFAIKSGTCYRCAYLPGKAERVFWIALGLCYMYDAIWGFSSLTNLCSRWNLFEMCWQSFVVSGDKAKKRQSLLELRENCFSWYEVQFNLFCYVFVCGDVACVKYLENIATSSAQYSTDRELIIVYDNKYKSIWCCSFSCLMTLLWRYVDTL
jgi:hypothetical protein